MLPPPQPIGNTDMSKRKQKSIHNPLRCFLEPAATANPKPNGASSVQADAISCVLFAGKMLAVAVFGAVTVKVEVAELAPSVMDGGDMAQVAIGVDPVTVQVSCTALPWKPFCGEMVSKSVPWLPGCTVMD